MWAIYRIHFEKKNNKKINKQTNINNMPVISTLLLVVKVFYFPGSNYQAQT